MACKGMIAGTPAVSVYVADSGNNIGTQITPGGVVTKVVWVKSA